MTNRPTYVKHEGYAASNDERFVAQGKIIELPVVEDSWTGLYRSKWKDLIVPDAVVHPAKFAKALIARIYDHAVEEGWLREGQRVLDPFGGVALGAFDAMRHGLDWTGVELEAKFAELGNQNITEWNRRFKGRLNVWGRARLLNGDSRRLLAVIAEQVEAIVSSPPFGDSQQVDNRVKESSAMSSTWRKRFGESTDGVDPLNLNNMKATDADFSAVVSSPPYSVDALGHKGKGNAIDEAKGLHARLNDNKYGEAAGQMSQMHEGDFDAVISSPPFVESLASDDPDKRGGLFHDPKRANDRTLTATYGTTHGQTGAMPEGDFAAVVSSPPYVDSMNAGKGGIDWEKAGRPDRLVPSDKRFGVEGSEQEKNYGKTDGQVGSLPEGDFDSVIASPPFEKGSEGVKRASKFKDPAAFANNGRGHSASPEAKLRSMQADDERAVYGDTEGNIGNMTGGQRDFDSVVTSPPYEEQPGHGDTLGRLESLRLAKSVADPCYGETEGQIAKRGDADTFWSASRLIVEQCYAALATGGHASFVTKRFVRNKKIVEFTDQWIQLCESVGFRLVHHHRAWLVEHKDAQHHLDGSVDSNDIERKSFFRRLAEKKGSPRIDWEDVVCFVKD